MATAGTRKEIQWGSVVKGAVIVTAAVVATVAAYSLFAGGVPFIADYLAANPGISSSLTTLSDNAIDLADTGIDLLKKGFGWAQSMLLAAPGALVDALGISATGSTAAMLSTSAQTAHTAGLIGATGVGAAATVVGVNALNGTDFIREIPEVPDTYLAQQSGMSHHAHSATPHYDALTTKHFAAEASEHRPPRKGWAHNFAQKTGLASHADAARASQNRGASSGSFAADLNADRAAIEDALRQR